MAGEETIDMGNLQEQKERVMKLNDSMRKNHIARIGKGKCDSKLTAPFNEIIHNIDRIGNSCLNRAEAASENVTVRTFFEMDDEQIKEVQLA